MSGLVSVDFNFVQTILESALFLTYLVENNKEILKNAKLNFQ